MATPRQDEIIKQITGKATQESKQSTLRFYVYSLVPCLAAVIWLGFSIHFVHKNNEIVNNLKKDSSLLSQSIINQKKELETLDDSIQSEYYRSRGLDPIHTPEELAESKKADAALKDILSKKGVNNTIRIEYLHKTLDDKKVWLALLELGYADIENKASNSYFKDVKTNCVIYGDSVKLNDLKIVLLTLVRAAIKIQVIDAYREHLQGNRNTIHINSIKFRAKDGDRPAISVEEIMNAKKLSDFRRYYYYTILQ